MICVSIPDFRWPSCRYHRVLAMLFYGVIPFLLLCIALSSSTPTGIPGFLTTPEMIARFDYPVASYKFKTKDGYTITLHNIPHGKGNNTRPIRDYSNPETRMPVLLFPGLYCQSYFFALYPSKSLAYTLPDLGYDTWIADFRGQSESEKGASPDALGPEGGNWNFSMDEIAEYDVTAFIDFVLAHTGAPKVTIVGHSMGNTVTFMALSAKPEYNKKVNLFIAFGPAVYISPVTGAAFPFIQFLPLRIIWVLQNLLAGFGRVQISGDEVRKLTSINCNIHSQQKHLICRLGANLFFGIDKTIPSHILPAMLSHTSAPSALMYVQFFQHSLSGRFAKLNMGPAMNMIKYGKPISPLYDLREITAPVALMSGWNDRLNNIYNVRYLMQYLPNVILNYVVPKETFNHVSFVAAEDIENLVNTYVYQMLETDYPPADPFKKLFIKTLEPSPDFIIPFLTAKLQHLVSRAYAEFFEWEEGRLML